MDPNDYTTAWTVYLCAAGVFSLMSWGILRRLPLRSLAFLLQCWLLALLFTPWYVQSDAELMAPAFIVLVLDLITIEPQAAIRALIPLVLSLALGLVVAIGLSIIDGLLRRRSRNKKKQPTRPRRPRQRAPMREPTLGDGEV